MTSAVDLPCPANVSDDTRVMTMTAITHMVIDLRKVCGLPRSQPIPRHLSQMSNSEHLSIDARHERSHSMTPESWTLSQTSSQVLPSSVGSPSSQPSSRQCSHTVEHVAVTPPPSPPAPDGGGFGGMCGQPSPLKLMAVRTALSAMVLRSFIGSHFRFWWGRLFTHPHITRYAHESAPRHAEKPIAVPLLPP